MKPILVAVFLASLIGTASAGASRFNKMRLADAATDACFASCTDTNASCKRVCPATFSTPCISACDSQAQTCRQSCRTR